MSYDGEVTQIRGLKAIRRRVERNGTKAGKEHGLFGRISGSNQGDTQLGVSPDSPLLGLA